MGKTGKERGPVNEQPDGRREKRAGEKICTVEVGVVGVMSNSIFISKEKKKREDREKEKIWA